MKDFEPVQDITLALSPEMLKLINITYPDNHKPVIQNQKLQRLEKNSSERH